MIDPASDIAAIRFVRTNQQCALMKHILAVAILLAAVSLAERPAAAQPSPELRNPNIATDYVGWKYQGLHDKLKKRGVLELMNAVLSPLRLKQKLTIEFDTCNTVNAFYNLRQKVTISYEFVEWLANHTAVPPEKRPNIPRRGLVPGVSRAEAIIGGLIGVALHEAGHAIFDIQRIPRLGREEDAADMIAGFVMLHIGDEVARVSVKGMYNLTYNWYANKPEIAPGNERQFYLADTHSLHLQRAYNFLCLAYGKDQKAFQDIANAWLPAQRRPNCPAEYQQALHAFTKTVLPDVDQELLKKVRTMPILQPGDAKL
jgi:hypothetical protein